MSGIPRYNNAPLNARSGVPVPPTGPSPPSSQVSPTASPSCPLTNPNPTTTSSPHPSYPQAHPAAAVPDATGLTTSPSQRYAPAVITGTENSPPTRTIKEDSDVPPAPQPAAFPKPTTGFAGNIYSSHAKTVVPPPPRAGQSASSMPWNINAGQADVRGVEGAHLEYPPQMNIPSPSVTRAPFSSTMTGTAGEIQTMHTQPVSVNDAYAQHGQYTRQSRNYQSEERRSLEYLEHPPGYVQNAYAAELSSDQRRAMVVNGGEGTRNRSGGEGLAVGGNVNGGGVGEEEGIWGSAKRWVGSAGSKLSEGEKEVWRRINGK